MEHILCEPDRGSSKVWVGGRDEGEGKGGGHRGSGQAIGGRDGQGPQGERGRGRWGGRGRGWGIVLDIPEGAGGRGGTGRRW